MNLFDSSALLCFLQGEDGADLVESQLDHPSVCSAANWSEVAQKVIGAGRDWSASRALLHNFSLSVEPVTEYDAEAAARLWRRGSGLSLGDRLCLATGDRLDATIWTADSAWGVTGRVRQVR
ncbi:MAG: type II toxin-antitoxin system VapC family toxin [Marmoricola sp.]